MPLHLNPTRLPESQRVQEPAQDSMLLETLQDRQPQTPPPPPRTPSNDQGARGGNPLYAQQVADEVAIDKAAPKKLSAVGPPFHSGPVKKLDEIGRSTERKIGQVVQVSSKSECNHCYAFEYAQRRWQSRSHSSDIETANMESQKESSSEKDSISPRDEHACFRQCNTACTCLLASRRY